MRGLTKQKPGASSASRFGEFQEQVNAYLSSLTPEQRQQMERASESYHEQQQRERRIQRLKLAGIPREKKKARVGHCPEIQLVDWTHDLLFSGKQGTGKTYAACALLVERAKDKTVRYASFGDVLDARFSREGMDRFRNVGVLILDDVGKTAQTCATVECLRDLIDWRHEEGKQTIITTSYGFLELVAKMEQGADLEHANDIRSRLRWYDVVRFEGSDRRC